MQTLFSIIREAYVLGSAVDRQMALQGMTFDGSEHQSAVKRLDRLIPNTADYTAEDVIGCCYLVEGGEFIRLSQADALGRARQIELSRKWY